VLDVCIATTCPTADGGHIEEEGRRRRRRKRRRGHIETEM
jgi:hypothetical protein